MAAITDSWKTTNVAANAGRLYRSVPVPGAGARPTILAGGLLDGTGEHMGATKGGAKVMAKVSMQGFKVDEFRADVLKIIDTIEAGIGGELVGVADMQLAAYLLPGVGTRLTAAGYDFVQLGAKAIAYDCIVLSFPLIESSAYSGWFMLYNGLNDAGVEWSQKRTEMSATPFSFVGTELTSRAAADTIGQFGKTIA